MSARKANPSERRVISKIAELCAAENWQGVVAVEKWQSESPNGAGLIYPLLGNTYVLLEQYSKEIAGHEQSRAISV